jgi:hypothetical protein
MNTQEEEIQSRSRPNMWMGLVKIVLIALIVVLLFLLVKDFIMPKKVVSIGLRSPSVNEYSIVQGLEKHSG